MIQSEAVITITFNEEDKNRIENASKTLNEIVEAFEKAGSYTAGYEQELNNVIIILNQILLGGVF